MGQLLKRWKVDDFEVATVSGDQFPFVQRAEGPVDVNACEVESIREMVVAAVARHGIVPARVLAMEVDVAVTSVDDD